MSKNPSQKIIELKKNVIWSEFFIINLLKIFKTRVKTCNTIKGNKKRITKVFNKDINKNSIELK